MIVAALLGCRASAPPLEHEAYVWQRAWTPAVEQGVAAGAAVFRGLRVHALAAGRDALVLHDVALSSLAATGRPIVVVARVEVGAGVTGAELGGALASIVARWRAAGVDVVGVEIDHDSPSSRLSAYAGFLEELRGSLPASIPLSITALPTWLDAPSTAEGGGLEVLWAAVDGSVLQVHANDDPSEALFEPLQARRWIDRWAARVPHPFQVAVPAYGVRLLGGSSDGGAPGIEAEALRLDRGPGGVELWAEPRDVLALLEGLAHDRPVGLDGIVWFRLPTSADRRAWSLSAIASVIEGTLPLASIEVGIESGPGSHDLWLVNRGSARGLVPDEIWIEGRCTAADGAGGYEVVHRRDRWGLRRHIQRGLAPSERLSIGWIRCIERPGVRVGEG
ncbi:MAG TPA: DUF3142 domain-containing protein [Deltaproteobacteria bacterium]|nr:DUF3142 domain-containing protein [Deltaproteobacteria bacterium]